MEVIESRHSVRDYLKKEIENEKRLILNSYINELNKESGLNMQLIYNEPNCFNNFLAHYGKFSNVENYIAIVGNKNKNLDEIVGYFGQKMVLKAQEIGLNTCWVAMTRGKSQALINQDEKLYIIIALGYGSTQGKLHKSKEITSLAKIGKDNPSWYLEGIKAAMLAPTALNQQKFYIERIGERVRISSKWGIKSKIDLGIVKCNFVTIFCKKYCKT